MEQYLYETHLHTSEGSACASNTGAEMVRAYKKAGYTGLIVTDHFFYGNTAIDRKLPWEEWVTAFCKGYENAKEEGDRIGLQVFFGWESGYEGTEFLIYGLDKEWLLQHPEIKDATIEDHSLADKLHIELHRAQALLPLIHLRGAVERVLLLSLQDQITLTHGQLIVLLCSQILLTRQKVVVVEVFVLLVGAV